MPPTYIYAILGVIALLAVMGSTGNSLIDAAVDFIIPHEGFRATPYWDARQWSIGYGTRIGTDRNNKPNVTWTKDQARTALANIVQSDYARLQELITRPLTDNQWIALLDFAYNLGVGGSSQIIDRINSGLPDNDIASAMKLYSYSNGTYLQVLADRRANEAHLFLT